MTFYSLYIFNRMIFINNYLSRCLYLNHNNTHLRIRRSLLLLLALYVPLFCKSSRGYLYTICIMVHMLLHIYIYIYIYNRILHTLTSISSRNIVALFITFTYVISGEFPVSSRHIALGTIRIQRSIT